MFAAVREKINRMEIEIDICYSGVAQLVRAPILYVGSVEGSSPSSTTKKLKQ